MTMKIAIPHDNGCLHGHFGGCREFALVHVDPEKKAPLRIEILAAPEHQPGAFPRWLREQGATVIIAGGIGRRALELFAQEGIDVRPGFVGASIDDLVTCYLEGTLTGSPEGCAGHGYHHHDHHGHEHEHGHEHGQGHPHDHRHEPPADTSP